MLVCRPLHLNSLVLAFAVLFGGISVTAHAVEATSAGEVSDLTRVVSLSPEDLPELSGRNPGAYSLAAVHNNRMVPIPFQIDERRESGFIYMKERSKKEKKKDPLVGKELFFDGDDEFLFMFKDAGDRVKNMMRVDGKLVGDGTAGPITQKLQAAWPAYYLAH